MKPIPLAISLIVLITLLFLANIILGNPQLELSNMFTIVSGGKGESAMDSYIVSHRLNRTLTAIFAGGGLALTGLILQVYFRNPLAGPGVLGITSGASLGVAIVVLGGVATLSLTGGMLIIIGGVLGAMAIMLLLLFLAKYVRSNISLLVIGLMFSYFSSAFVSTLYLWADEVNTREYILWGLGNFEGRSMLEIGVLASIVSIGLICSLGISRSLNGIVLGEDYAKSMGISHAKLKWTIIGVTGIIAGIVTVFCGPIGFIGLAVPQLIRIIVKSTNHFYLIPLAFLGGAFLGLSSDFIVRMSENQLPINAVTALAGAPIVIYIIVKLNRGRA